MKYSVTVRGMLKGTSEQARFLHNSIVADAGLPAATREPKGAGDTEIIKT